MRKQDHPGRVLTRDNTGPGRPVHERAIGYDIGLRDPGKGCSRAQNLPPALKDCVRHRDLRSGGSDTDSATTRLGKSGSKS